MKILFLLLLLSVAALLPASRQHSPLDSAFGDQDQEDGDEFVSKPHKKSTVLLNKLMNALNKAMEKEQTPPSGQSGADGMAAVAMPSVSRSNLIENQLRGPDERMFWKCYFNAVSCF